MVENERIHGVPSRMGRDVTIIGSNTPMIVHFSLIKRTFRPIRDGGSMSLFFYQHPVPYGTKTSTSTRKSMSPKKDILFHEEITKNQSKNKFASIRVIR